VQAAVPVAVGPEDALGDIELALGEATDALAEVAGELLGWALGPAVELIGVQPAAAPRATATRAPAAIRREMITALR
jgi:hypothetical protein